MRRVMCRVMYRMLGLVPPNRARLNPAQRVQVARRELVWRVVLGGAIRVV